MAHGFKTGGRVKGSRNKPKVATDATTRVATDDTTIIVTDATTSVAADATTAVAAAALPAGGAGAGAGAAVQSFAMRAPARAPAREAAKTGLKIRYKALDDLQEYEGNANEHPPHQIALIERLLTQFGWLTAMGVADGVLIYGHARRQAAINLRDRGIAIPGNPDPDKGPVVDLSHLSPEDRRAYVIADNQSARKSTTNKDTLRIELAELGRVNYDLTLTGYDLGQISALDLGGNASEAEGDEQETDAKVCCPQCGHELPAFSKATRQGVRKALRASDTTKRLKEAA